MLESLENNEVILLMYLAGELPEMDRQEVAQLLAADAGLRREFEQLRVTQESIEGGLAALDSVESLPPESAAVRRIGRALRQQLAFRAAEAAHAVKPNPKLVLAWWAYPSIAAALIFMAFLTWVITYNLGAHKLPPLAVVPPATQGTPESVANNTPTETAPSTDLDPAQGDGRELANEIEASFGPSTEKEDNQMVALHDDPQLALGGDKND